VQSLIRVLVRFVAESHLEALRLAEKRAGGRLSRIMPAEPRCRSCEITESLDPECTTGNHDFENLFETLICGPIGLKPDLDRFG
jgi:hypothetical protein